MHKDYSDYIDIAENLSDTVAINGRFVGQIKLIPIRSWTHCNRDALTGSNCMGPYAIYIEGANSKFLSNAYCQVDTQANNTYFQNITIPNAKNKMLVCLGLEGTQELGGRNLYILRLSTFSITGLGNIGQYGDNWYEFTPPYEPRGFNSQIFVSPKKGDLLYSPI